TAGRRPTPAGVRRAHHQAGRHTPANIQPRANPAAPNGPAGRQEIADSMRQFIRMYEPHAAREDTVLFPAFGKLIGEKELHKLMEIFEQKERALPLGDFEKMVTDVAAIERTFGIYDLAQFTPTV